MLNPLIAEKLKQTALALLFTAAALAVQLAGASIVEPWPAYPFTIAAAAAALYGGLGSGLLALAFSSLIIVANPMNSPGMIRVAEPAGALQLVIFDLATLFLVIIISRYRRGHAEAQVLRADATRQFETIANIAPVMVWVRDRDNMCTFLNRGWVEYTGRSAEGQYGTGWLESVHPDDAAPLASVYASSAESRKSFRMEYRLRRHDGEYRWVLEEGVPRHSADGEFDGYIGSSIDVHDMKLALDERRSLVSRLEEERERIQNIISNVPGVVWEALGAPGTSSQRVDFVSGHVERMLGYSVEEWLAHPNFWLSIVHPDDQESAAATAAAHFAAGGTSSNSFRWMTKDGHAIDVESHSTVVVDRDGQPVGMRGVTMDVSARKRAEESLRFLASASDVLASSLDYEVTISTAVRLALPTLADMCLVDLVSEDGTTIDRFASAHADPDKQWLADRMKASVPDVAGDTATAQALRDRKPVVANRTTAEDVAARIQDQAQAEVIHELGIASYLAIPMIARERVLGVIVFTSEVPDRYDEFNVELGVLLARRAAVAVDNARLYRAALSASHAKDEFLATVSHELRTPMTATLGWVRMLQAMQLDEETQATALDAIHRSTTAQARLIEDILDVSSIVLGKFKLDIETVDLGAIVEAAIGTLRPAIAARQMSIEVTDSARSSHVRGDPARLQQVVWNLLSNAIKFGHAGGRLRVTIADRDACAIVTVADDGAGIEPDVLPHIFERFRQGESGPTRRFGGLGLGLSIVRHLVELHGGRVSAESDGPGRGATFTIELPLLEHDPHTAVHEVKHPLLG